MVVGKLLRNPCTSLGKNVWQVRNSFESVRRTHTVGVPPEKKLTFGEMLAYGTGLGVAMWFAPFWILYHIPDYQKENRNEYTGR